jgi:hypothetical protein
MVLADTRLELDQAERYYRKSGPPAVRGSTPDTTAELGRGGPGL